MAKAIKTTTERVELPTIPQMHVQVNFVSDKGRVLLRGTGGINLQSREMDPDLVEKGDVLLLREVSIQRAQVKLADPDTPGSKTETWAQDLSCEEYLQADGSELVANSTESTAQVASDTPPE